MQNKYKTGRIRSDNRAKIIAIAEIEFAEFGYKGASIMNIAKRADMPRANVHYYFKSKLELYKKVLFDILKLWNDAFNQITPEDDPAEAIGAYIRAKVMYSKTNPLASKIFASSKILEVHGQRMLDRTFDPGFRIRLHQKDLNLALSTGQEINAVLPNTAIAQELFNCCAANGDSDLDHSAMVTALEKMASHQLDN
jgi:TetR/AcrR family transcriptional regulator